MGLSAKDKIRFEKIDLEAKEMYLNGDSITKIAKHFRIKRESLSRRLQEKFNIEIKNDNNKLPIDSNFFSVIDTESKAYWLGYVLADGCISGTSFELTSKDKDILLKFRQDLKSKHKIQEKIINGTSYYRISIRDKFIICDLKSYGICERKSFIEVGLPNVDKALYNHMLRGFFDGDGCVFRYKNTNKIFVTFTVGKANMKMATEIVDFFKSINIIFKIYNGRTCLTVTTSKKEEAIKALSYLYDNATLYMDRKYEKYKSLLPS